MKGNLKNMLLTFMICVLADKSKLTEIFPKGEKGSSKTFTGNADPASVVLK